MNKKDAIDYSTIEKLMNFLPFKYTKKVSEEEFTKDFVNCCSNKFDILPELVHILNLKELLKFLYIFSGKELKIPEKKSILNALRDLDIFYCYSENPNKQELNRLSSKYNITNQNITGIIEKVAKSINKPNPLT